MRLVYLSLLLFALNGSLFGQDYAIIDSLVNLSFKQNTSAVSIVEQLLNDSKKYEQNPLIGLALADTSLTLLKDEGKDRLLADIYFLQAVSYKEIEELDAGIKAYGQALKRYQKLGNKERIAACNQGLGILSEEDEDASIAYFERAQAILRKEGKDSLRIAYFNDAVIAFEYLNNLPLALSYADSAIAIATENGMDSLRLLSQFNKTLTLSLISIEQRLELSLLIYPDAGKIAPKLQVEIGNDIAESYVNLGDYLSAINYLEKTIPLSIAIRNYEEESYAYKVLGYVYLELDMLKEALFYTEKAIFLAKKIKNERFIVSAIINKVYIFIEQAKYQECIELINKESKLSTNDEDKEELGFLLASVYSKSKDFATSLSLYEQFIQKNDAASTNILTLDAWVGMSICYLNLGLFDKAEEYARKAQELNNQLGFLNAESILYNVYYKINKANNNPFLALEYLEKKMATDSVLNNSSSEKRVLQSLLKQKTDQEKKELQAKQLTKENILKAKAQRNSIIAISLGGLVLLMLAFFIQSRRKNNTISLQNDQLQKLNQAKDYIFAILGHDLRKPAIAFRGIAKKINYLLQKQDYKRLDALGQAVENDANALSYLTDNLLNWALQQKNLLSYQPQFILLSFIITDVLNTFEGIAKHKQINIKIDLPKGLKIYADPSSLQIIIRNLLDNAVKFTPLGGEINIKATVESDSVQISIIDTGVGMAENDLEKLFLLYEGKSKKGTDGEKGTGLGLYLVQELMALNKGRLIVKSRVNEGSSFILSFPK